MNKKVISLSLAAIMAAQPIAYAGKDRTSAVTDQTIAEAKKN